MYDPRPRGPAHSHRIPGQVRIGHSRKNSIFFMAHVDELDLPVAPQRVNRGIERVPNNAIASFHSRIHQHLPQKVRNFSRHESPPANLDSFSAIQVSPDVISRPIPPPKRARPRLEFCRTSPPNLPALPLLLSEVNTSPLPL